MRSAGLTAMVLMISEKSIDGRLTPPSPGRYAIDRLKRATGGRRPSCTWTEKIETVARISSTELSRERHGPRQAHFGAAVGKDSKPKGESDVAYSIGRYIRVSPTLIGWRSGVERVRAGKARIVIGACNKAHAFGLFSTVVIKWEC